MNKDETLIRFNEKVHNLIGNNYDEKHKNNIFNSIEQNRLREHLKFAVKNISSDKKRTFLKALDFGSGTGNLTYHLIELGLHVAAADISKKLLEYIKLKYGQTKKCMTLKLESEGLSKIGDNTYDIVACYSVLHHIPDYLKAVDDMIRICKPGGIIYIDHEVNNYYWNPNKEYFEFLKLNKKFTKQNVIKWKKYIKLSNYVKLFLFYLRKINAFKTVSITNPLHPRYQPDGDIHVWNDDHIEWDKIEEIFNNNNCEIILVNDYLLYKNGYNLNIFNEFKNKCSDYRVLVAKKL